MGVTHRQEWAQPSSVSPVSRSVKEVTPQPYKGRGYKRDAMTENMMGPFVQQTDERAG